MRADFDYVLALYDREHNLFNKYYPEDMARTLVSLKIC